MRSYHFAQSKFGWLQGTGIARGEGLEFNQVRRLLTRLLLLIPIRGNAEALARELFVRKSVLFPNPHFQSSPKSKIALAAGVSFIELKRAPGKIHAVTAFIATDAGMMQSHFLEPPTKSRIQNLIRKFSGQLEISKSSIQTVHAIFL